MLQKINKKKSTVNNVIPVFKPLIQDCDISAASRSLKEGWLGMGKDVQNLELTIKNICPFLYTLRVLNRRRDELRSYLSNLLVDTGIHWQPGNKFKYFKNSKNSDLKVTEKI